MANVKKPHSGRNGYSPTEADRQFVSRAVRAGSRINDIADCLNVSDDTLRKHFRYEIMTARETLKVSAIGVIEDSLQDGSLDAAKYVLSRVAGWAETSKSEVTGKDGGPIVVKEVSNLTDAQLEALAALETGDAD